VATASTDILPPGGLKTITKRYKYYTVFEFDPDKSAQNAAKHGIDFIEAQALWETETVSVASNQNVLEPRELAIGRIGDRIWTAIITRRNDRIRIISVRRARPNEEETYERNRNQED
jgi:uncharacterized DUF497 family protein